MIQSVRLTRRRWIGAGAATAALATGVASVRSAEPPANPALQGRLVAAGIPGAGAISPVGAFLPGGPIHDNPVFAALTQPGRILSPERILVASTANFGAPLWRQAWAPGAILSLWPDGDAPLHVPPEFAAGDGQASALEGAVQLFAAQSPAFVNGYHHPQAVTADLPGVANPLGISLNNAFGRLWFACSPEGPSGPGMESILDADGLPLAGAPSKIAGGVFAGSATNRLPEQAVPGDLSCGAVATAMVGASPDDSGRAVFVVGCADGSIVQLHSEHGVDGLAPAGTFTSLAPAFPEGQPEAEPVPSPVNRTGMVFNWVPDAIVYVADPLGNAVVALTLEGDGIVFGVRDVRRIESPAFNLPFDLAPAVPETISPAFASNTTLAGGADLYVANRGDGTIARLSQDGHVLEVRPIEVPGLGRLGAGLLNGIAVSPDGRRLWVTVSASLPDVPDSDGLVVELPAFGAAAEPAPTS